MSSYIPESLRTLVARRANFTCEYCLISQEDTFHTCQIDHIISTKDFNNIEAVIDRRLLIQAERYPPAL